MAKAGGSVQNPSRKTMTKCDHDKTSEALYIWFSPLRTKGTPVTGVMLKEKALYFHSQFKDGDEEFSTSVAWFDRWKKRYGMRQLNVCGEKLSANDEIIPAFTKSFKEFIKKEELSVEQIFIYDETGLNFRMLPQKNIGIYRPSFCILPTENCQPSFCVYRRRTNNATLYHCSTSP